MWSKERIYQRDVRIVVRFEGLEKEVNKDMKMAFILIAKLLRSVSKNVK